MPPYLRVRLATNFYPQHAQPTQAGLRCAARTHDGARSAQVAHRVHQPPRQGWPEGLMGNGQELTPRPHGGIKVKLIWPMNAASICAPAGNRPKSEAGERTIQHGNQTRLEGVIQKQSRVLRV